MKTNKRNFVIFSLLLIMIMFVLAVPLAAASSTSPSLAVGAAGFEIKLTFDLLPVIAVLVSILAWYIPKFKDWYGSLAPEKKQLFMVGLMAAVVLGAVGLSLLGFAQIYSGPTWKEWVWYPLVDFVFAVIINAGAYKGTNYMLGGKSGGITNIDDRLPR